MRTSIFSCDQPPFVTFAIRSCFLHTECDWFSDHRDPKYSHADGHRKRCRKARTWHCPARRVGRCHRSSERRDGKPRRSVSPTRAVSAREPVEFAFTSCNDRRESLAGLGTSCTCFDNTFAIADWQLHQNATCEIARRIAGFILHGGLSPRDFD